MSRGAKPGRYATVTPRRTPRSLVQPPVPPLSLEEVLQQAVAHHQTGRLDEAQTLYRSILEVSPEHLDARHNLGVLLVQRGQVADALPLFKAVLEAYPAQGQFWLSYAESLVATGQADEARQLLRQGRERGLAGDGADALDARVREALARQPDKAGIAELIRKGDLGSAQAFVQEQIECLGRLPVLLQMMGEILLRQGCDAQALPWLENACTADPGNVNAWNQRALALNHLERFAESHQIYQKALELKPDDPELLANLADNLNDAQLYEQALPWLERALQKDPLALAARVNMAGALIGLNRHSDALPLLKAVVEEEGYRRVEAFQLYGHALAQTGEVDQAITWLREAVELDPGHAKAQSSLMFSLAYCARHAPSTMRAEAQRFGKIVSSKVSAPHQNWHRPQPGQRLRVGLVSGDLGEHPVGYFLEGMLRYWPNERIELLAYPTVPRTDALAERIKPGFAAWHGLRGLTDEAAAQRIHNDGVQVLLDLSGHTGNNRLGMFARRPAPVQASWLGYFATTGVPGMDYVLGDPYVTPPDEAHHFTEQVWRLPESYLCFTPPDVPLTVSPLPALQAGVVTFGCFNNLAKMGDAVVALWAQVLHAVPNSRLLLKTKQLEQTFVAQRTHERFASQGIPPERLILEGPSPRIELLAAYGRVDIALDPFPYPGGTTSAEALWMGVPVLSRRGDRFLSHVGETIAHNAGLPRWIARDDADYVAKAVAFASDAAALARLRAGLRAQVLASPLFDAPRFARHFEEALWGMWQHWLNTQEERLR